jgi:hypothetical protein
LLQQAGQVVSERLLDGNVLQNAVSRTQSLNNLKQMAIGTHNFHDEKHTIPAGTLLAADGTPLHGWGTLLLPYIEHEKLAKRIRLDVPWTHPENRLHFGVAVPQYYLLGPPVKDSLGMSEYAANVHVMNAVPRTLNGIPDGLANTLLFGEALANHRPWGHPYNWRDPLLGINQSPDGFGFAHRKNAVFALADGSVRAIDEKISPRVLKALATPAGWEVIDDPDW